MPEFPSESMSQEVLQQSWNAYLSTLSDLALSELKSKLTKLNIIEAEQTSRLTQLTPNEVRQVMDYIEVMADAYRNIGGITLQYLQNILHHVVSSDIYPAAYPVSGVDAPNRPAAVTVKGLQTAEMARIAPSGLDTGQTVAAVEQDEDMFLTLIKATKKLDIIKRRVQERLDTLPAGKDREDLKDAIVTAIIKGEFIYLDQPQLDDLKTFVEKLG